jgi:sugar phosphate isomerase/epimerase
MTTHTVSRRTFLAMSATLPFALRTSVASSIPVGLELYSVRKELQRDPQATVRAVAKMGYQCVEFYAPYFQWSEDETKQMRKLLDDLGIRCYSTHNDSSNVNAENIAKTRDRNLILGCKYVVVASFHPLPTELDGWKAVADALNSADEQLAKAGLHAGYHNHEPEFTPIGGGRPMEVIAKNTKPSIMLQLDVGTCLKAGSDPVAWIRANPGRIRSLHLKEWSSDPAKGYSVLFGEGNADWKGILAAAESVGGAEYYLIEQEGSRFSELETAERCLQAFRVTHPS